MKKIFFILSIIGILGSCSKDLDSNFSIEGNVKGMRKGIVYLQQDIDGQLVTVDSLFLKGTDFFEFEGNIESPEVFYLSTSRRNSSTLPIFVEKNKILIDADVKDLLGADIKGSENQELLDKFNKIIGRFNSYKNELYVKGLQASNKKHLKTFKSLSSQYEKNEVKKLRYILNFAVTNGSKDIAPYVALNYLSSSDITVLDTINNSMTPEIKNGKYGQELNELVTQIKATTVGNKFPEITQNDTTGTGIKLENKNGLMLVKFWTSSAENSRMSNSMAKNISEKYSEDQIKIISVSLDTNKDMWIEAVKEDKLPWLQVSDLKGYKNEAARKLAIRVIPESVLVDQNGIIIGRNMMQDEVIAKVDDFVENNAATDN
ncbi:MAG: TlpA disulfide reductase family protein [Bacteroidota bacterium]